MAEDSELRSFIYGSEQLIRPITDDFTTALMGLNSFKLGNMQYAESRLKAFNITFYSSARELLCFAFAVPNTVYALTAQKPLETAYQM